MVTAASKSVTASKGKSSKRSSRRRRSVAELCYSPTAPASIPLEYLTPTSEDRAIEVQTLLAEITR